MKNIFSHITAITSLLVPATFANYIVAWTMSSILPLEFTPVFIVLMLLTLATLIFVGVMDKFTSEE